MRQIGSCDPIHNRLQRITRDIDFEVMIRPMKALPAVIEAMGNRIDSPMAKRKAAATATGRPHPCYNDAF
jgi:hypothetical protein